MKQTAMFQSRDGLYSLEYHVYEPICFNGILIQIAHGMAEHKERYDDFCSYLSSLGYIVVVHDHRGHGKKANDKHRHGDMGNNGFEEAVHDLHELTRIVKEKYQPEKIVLLGHSMGSLLARRYLVMYGEELSGLILTGTPSKPAGLRSAMTLVRVISMIYGKEYQSQFLDKLVFGSFNRSFVERTGFEWLNQDEKAVDAYVNDEYCGFIFSARSFHDLFDGMKKVFGKYPVAVKSDLPILILSGAEDPCGLMGRGVEKSLKHLKKQGYNNISMKLMPKMRHEILLEIDHQLTYDEIASFIKNI